MAPASSGGANVLVVGGYIAVDVFCSRRFWTVGGWSCLSEGTMLVTRRRRRRRLMVVASGGGRCRIRQFLALVAVWLMRFVGLWWGLVVGVVFFGLVVGVVYWMAKCVAGVNGGGVQAQMDGDYVGARLKWRWLRLWLGGKWSCFVDTFFVDRVPIRVFKNNGDPNNNFFPNQKPMYLFSSIWNADDWATRGGLEKTDWKKAPFVSSYKDFSVDGCQWEDPYPACVSTTTKNWWDQYPAWHLSESQKKDFAWVNRNFVVYDYCKDPIRYTTPMEECSLDPLD